MHHGVEKQHQCVCFQKAENELRGNGQAVCCGIMGDVSVSLHFFMNVCCFYHQKRDLSTDTTMGILSMPQGRAWPGQQGAHVPSLHTLGHPHFRRVCNPRLLCLHLSCSQIPTLTCATCSLMTEGHLGRGWGGLQGTSKGVCTGA